MRSEDVMRYRLVCKFSLCLLLVTAAASASTITCGTAVGTSLDKYIALGASGCKIGNLIFANFAYSYTLGTDSFFPGGPLIGLGTQQVASAVTVTVTPVNDQFLFGGNWVIDHFQTANLSLSFTVTAPPANPISTLRSVFTGIPSGVENGGPITTTAAVCSGGTCASTNFANVTKIITPTTGPLTISTLVTLNANGSTLSSQNIDHLSIIQTQFAQTAPAGNVPEPVTYALTGAGIGALAWLRRRRKQT
jgi:hypothetical protein